MTDPTPVEVVAPNPIPVIVAEDRRDTAATPKQNQRADPSVPAKTTFQEDLTKAGQRAINLKWETTQQQIAVMVSGVVLLVCAWVVVGGDVAMRSAAFLFLTNIMTGVTTTYFVRTNHTKQGGVGEHDTGR